MQELLRKERLERLHRLPDSNIQQYPTGFASTELGQLLQVQRTAAGHLGHRDCACLDCLQSPVLFTQLSAIAQSFTFDVPQVDSLNIQSLSQNLYSQGLDVLSAPPGLEQQVRA